jgi:hypothetical protein
MTLQSRAVSVQRVARISVSVTVLVFLEVLLLCALRAGAGRARQPR